MRQSYGSASEPSATQQQRAWHSAVRGLTTMRGMEEGQAAALGRAAIAERRARAGGGDRNSKARRAAYGCGALVVLLAFLALLFFFVVEPDLKSEASDSSSTGAKTTPSPVHRPRVRRRHNVHRNHRGK